MHAHTWHLTRHNVDYIAYVFITLGILLALPQVIQIYSTHDASGVSIITWAGWAVFGFFWAFYGYYRRIRPILISSIFKIIINSMVVYGVILYG